MQMAFPCRRKAASDWGPGDVAEPPHAETTTAMMTAKVPTEHDVTLAGNRYLVVTLSGVNVVSVDFLLLNVILPLSVAD